MAKAIAHDETLAMLVPTVLREHGPESDCHVGAQMLQQLQQHAET